MIWGCEEIGGDGMVGYGVLGDWLKEVGLEGENGGSEKGDKGI